MGSVVRDMFLALWTALCTGGMTVVMVWVVRRLNGRMSHVEDQVSEIILRMGQLEQMAELMDRVGVLEENGNGNGDGEKVSHG